MEDVGAIPEGEDYRNYLNPESLKTVTCYTEPALAAVAPGTKVQFERTGYFCADAKEHSAEKPVFNRTVQLKDSWQKIAAKN